MAIFAVFLTGYTRQRTYAFMQDRGKCLCGVYVRWSGPSPITGRDRTGSASCKLFKRWHVLNVVLDIMSIVKVSCVGYHVRSGSGVDPRGRLTAWARGAHEHRGPMLIYVCCDLLSVNKYYTILNYKYLLLENAYLACVLLKIMNNINVYFYDNKWTLAFVSR